MSVVTEVGGTPLPDDLPDVFGEFCAAGLWPGLDRKLAGQLAGAGITGPALVTAGRLELINGISAERAQWLAAAFHDARPCYETAQLLAACQVPARFAGPAVAMLGRTAQDQLRQDPWRLLALPQIRPDQADWFARKLLRGQATPQDRRRGRALVSYLLARAARGGHTAVPAGVIAGALARFRIEDPAAAIAAAVDEGAVLPFEADPGEADPGEADPAEADPGEATDTAGDEFAAEDGLDDSEDCEDSENGEGRRRPGSCWRCPATPWRRRWPRRGCSGSPPWLSRSTRRTMIQTPTPPWPQTLTPPSRKPCERSPSTGCPSSLAARAPARAVRWQRWWRWPPSAA